MIPPFTHAMSRQEPFALNSGEDSGQAIGTGQFARVRQLAELLQLIGRADAESGDSAALSYDARVDFSLT
jgi:hypothetical protein